MKVNVCIHSLLFTHFIESIVRCHWRGRSRSARQRCTRAGSLCGSWSRASPSPRAPPCCRSARTPARTWTSTGACWCGSRAAITTCTAPCWSGPTCRTRTSPCSSSTMTVTAPCAATLPSHSQGKGVRIQFWLIIGPRVALSKLTYLLKCW